MTDKPDEPEDIDPTTRTGFFTTVDGTPIHVQGDPDMDDATMDAIAALVRGALKLRQAALDELTRTAQEDGYEGRGEGE